MAVARWERWITADSGRGRATAMEGDTIYDEPNIVNIHVSHGGVAALLPGFAII